MKNTIKREKENWFKRKFQSLKTGFDHGEAFDFVSWHAKIVLPRLKFLRENHTGYPPSLERNMGLVGMSEEEKNKRWDKVLDKIIWSFENIENTDPESRRDIEKGLTLFGKFYLDLWD